MKQNEIATNKKEMKQKQWNFTRAQTTHTFKATYLKIDF